MRIVLALVLALVPALVWPQPASPPSITRNGSTVTGNVTVRAPVALGPELTLTSSSGTASHVFYHASNGELAIQNDAAGVNTLIVENLNASGFGALVARSFDFSFPSVAQSATGSYEHLAIGYGPSLSLNGRGGLNYLESSRFPGGQNTAYWPTQFAIQQTGGVMLAPTQDTIATTTGSSIVTKTGGGTFPPGINGYTIREVGDGWNLPAGTTILSGADTSTLNLSNKSTGNGSALKVIYGALSAGQYNAAVFRDMTSIDWYSWATGTPNNAPTAPYLKFDRINGRVAVGSLANDTVPIASLDVIGQGYFGSATSSRNQTYAHAPLNVIDSGSNGIHWLKVGVNTFRMDWPANPANGVTLGFANGAPSPALTLVADESGTVKFGGGVIQALRRVSAPGVVSVVASDHIVVIAKTIGAATAVRLPNNPEIGREYIIKDGKGDAAKHVITVAPNAGTIDGAASAAISSNYGGLRLVYDGVEWGAL